MEKPRAAGLEVCLGAARGLGGWEPLGPRPRAALLWLQGPAAGEQPLSLAQEGDLGHKFKMTVLTNTISAFLFGFRKGMMALPGNHY